MSLCSPGDHEDVRDFPWRLSFSRAEKQLTKYADRQVSDLAPITCRKRVLRVLKRMLEIIKGFDNSRMGIPNPKMMELQRAAEHLRGHGRDIKIEKFTTFQVCTMKILSHSRCVLATYE